MDRPMHQTPILALADADIKRFPTLPLGIASLEVPAITIPIASSIAFLILRSRKDRFLQDHGPANPPEPASKEKRTIDETTAQDNPAAQNAPRDRLEEPTGWKWYLLHALRGYYMFRTVRMLSALPKTKEEIQMVCLSETAALGVTALLLDPKLLSVCATVCLGWVVLYFQQSYETAPSPLLSGLIALLILTALWPQKIPKKRPGLMGVFWSSSLLLALAINPHLPPTNHLRTWKLPVSRENELWPWALLFGLSYLNDSINWLQTSRSLKDARSGVLDHVHEIASILRLLASICAMFIFTSFNASCMGFRSLLRDREATGPTFPDGGVLAGFLALKVWMGFSLYGMWRGEGEGMSLRERRKRFLRRGFLAGGWTVVALLGLAGFVMPFRVWFQ